MIILQKDASAHIFKIGGKIRKWRKEKGIKQVDFAKKLYISSKILRKVEQDKISIDHLQSRIIACQLNINFSQLLIDPDTLYQLNFELSFN